MKRYGYTDFGKEAVLLPKPTPTRRPEAPNAPSLWDAPAPSVPRATSEDAADAQSRTKRQADRVRILRAVAFTRDGLTRDEIAERLAISPNTVRPRVVELMTQGFLADGRVTRLTETGHPAAVCDVTEAGRNWLDNHKPETR